MIELSWQLVVLLLGVLGIPYLCHTAKKMLIILVQRPQPNIYAIKKDTVEQKTKQEYEKRRKRSCNFFFAGSKELEIERNIFYGAIGELQLKWKNKGLDIYGISYKNFEHEVVLKGPQAEYNAFIQNYTDAIFFTLNGNVGGITKEEFDLAMDTFKQKGAPKIFSYSKLNDAPNSSVDDLRKKTCVGKQYWQDYIDDTHLKLLIGHDIKDVASAIIENQIIINSI